MYVPHAPAAVRQDYSEDLRGGSASMYAASVKCPCKSWCAIRDLCLGYPRTTKSVPASMRSRHVSQKHQLNIRCSYVRAKRRTTAKCARRSSRPSVETRTHAGGTGMLCQFKEGPAPTTLANFSGSCIPAVDADRSFSGSRPRRSSGCRAAFSPVRPRGRGPGVRCCGCVQGKPLWTQRKAQTHDVQTVIEH